MKKKTDTVLNIDVKKLVNANQAKVGVFLVLLDDDGGDDDDDIDD